METELHALDEDLESEKTEVRTKSRKFELTDLGSARIETQGSTGGTTDTPFPNHE